MDVSFVETASVRTASQLCVSIGPGHWTVGAVVSLTLMVWLQLAGLPQVSLFRDDIARWMQDLSEKSATGKTVANKHGFLSSALNAAVRASKTPSVRPPSL